MPGLNELLAAVRAQESQDSLNGYEMTNGDARGAYQFEPAAFITTGYQNEDGTWTGKNGISSYSDWLDISNPDIRNIQDSAFLEWIMYQWRQIRGDDAEPLAGQTLNGVELTISGMILGSHLIGETDFRNTYIFSGGTDLQVDGNGKLRPIISSNSAAMILLTYQALTLTLFLLALLNTLSPTTILTTHSTGTPTTTLI